MNTKLSKVKVNQIYSFHIVEGGGAGSGSQTWYNVMGEVKEINAEFIRVIPTANIKEGNKRSVKIYNNTIAQISE